MTKQYLPIVTQETIKEVGQDAVENRDEMFMAMAASNPDLYRLIYEVHNRPETTKTTMLGMAVAMYHCLERQTKKERRDRRRIKGNGA